ncbi:MULTISPECIES: DUF6993 domain-containing protein [unclassified Microbacterium]|uniref:DUF6993 domain-containing protein n=1 Tax=unclassified Microbacterium TaxID=2609290 RepID=UPI001604E2D1|nr:MULTISPECIES: hypothetical protein [unclassified Microbacterium]QNA92577.1 hypothetical protein G4G29_09680 [Microbacterium sp. Se63.02b]QYM65875.1 hypothetical protein K1X59_09715 [Microbacterium sp. Se5.02b]
MLRRSVSSPARTVGVFAASVAALVLLSGCTSAEPSVSASPTSAVSPSPAPSAPAGPVLVPDGTAEENLPLFTAIAEGVWATDQRGSGRAYIDALIGAGFDRGAMQVTQDRSTVGNPAESLQFSVRWGETECLVGQVGPSTGQVVTTVLPQLAEGRCLVGTTRPIDW